MPIRQTERGFNVYAEFDDTYGADVRVQESSSAEEPRVWVFVAGGQVVDVGSVNDGNVHLNREQAIKLIAALQEWVDEQET